MVRSLTINDAGTTYKSELTNPSSMFRTKEEEEEEEEEEARDRVRRE